MINEPLRILPEEDDKNRFGSFGTQPNTNLGLGAFGFQPTQTKSLGDIAKEVAKNKAIDYVGNKLGIKALGSILSGAELFGNPLGFAAFGPAGVGIGALANFGRGLQNTTFGRSATIADYLAAKRAEKAAKKDADRDDQGDITTYSIPSPHDAARGGQYEGGRGEGVRDSSGPTGGYSYDSGGRQGFGYGL